MNTVVLRSGEVFQWQISHANQLSSKPIRVILNEQQEQTIRECEFIVPQKEAINFNECSVADLGRISYWLAADFEMIAAGCGL